MKIALFGATGHLGHSILEEALTRGYTVIAIVRDPARLTRHDNQLTVIRGDVTQPASWLKAVRDVDAVVASLSGRRGNHHDSVPASARVLLAQLPAAGVKRLLWVGGAGSLETAPGVMVIDDPKFPADLKPEVAAQQQALEIFRNSPGEVEWTYVSPAALIEDGERRGRYRIGGDQLLVDTKGVSRISVADYAVALLDRIEQHDALSQRITVAY